MSPWAHLFFTLLYLPVQISNIVVTFQEFPIRVDQKSPFDTSRLVAAFADRGRRGNQAVVLQGRMSMVVILVSSRLLEKFYEYSTDFTEILKICRTLLGLGKFEVK